MQLKTILITTCFLCLSSLTLLGQDLINKPVASLKLRMEQEGGKNGAAVVYNPDRQFYYAVFAGNASFPLETFDAMGNNIALAEANYDIRGMWWNPKADALEGNAYNDVGIVNLGLKSTGYAGAGSRIIFEGNHQPDGQSVGVLDRKGKEILYYHEGKVIGYSRKTGERSKTNITLDLPVSQDNINYTTLVATGKKKMELGVLDFENNKLYLFNRKDGSHVGTVTLPSDADINYYFNFSYANNYLFLFDDSIRTWVGYKIF